MELWIADAHKGEGLGAFIVDVLSSANYFFLCL